MTNLSYVLLDVFTSQPFGGNQLAVFPAAGALEPALMQAIARELNLSETVFAEPLEEGRSWRLRIFTPAMELPFAGHPTVGAAIALARLGHCDDSGSIAFEEGVGTVDVEFSRSEGRALVATLDSPRMSARLVQSADREALAAVLGLAETDLAPVEASAWSAGVPFTFIPLADRDALARVVFDVQAWRDALSGSEAPHVIAYSADAAAADVVHVRMFAPLMGIAEDPATGAAAAALAGLLADRHGHADGDLCFLVRQADDMGRPSVIRLAVSVDGGAVRRVRVGGEAVLVGDGRLELPA